MSDPFGEDETDFDVEGLLTGAYGNAISCLSDTQVPYVDEVPKLRHPNPLVPEPQQPEDTKLVANANPIGASPKDKPKAPTKALETWTDIHRRHSRPSSPRSDLAMETEINLSKELMNSHAEQ